MAQIWFRGVGVVWTAALVFGAQGCAGSSASNIRGIEESGVIVVPATFEMNGRPVLIENHETRRYVFCDEPPQREDGRATGDSNVNIVGADANYYNRALLHVRPVRNAFLIECADTGLFLTSLGPPLVRPRGAEGGWLADSGYASPMVVGAPDRRDDRALWTIRRVSGGFLFENVHTKRYLFSDGPPLGAERGAEGGWLASSGFASPNMVGADENYYDRAVFTFVVPE